MQRRCAEQARAELHGEGEKGRNNEDEDARRREVDGGEQHATALAWRTTSNATVLGTSGSSEQFARVIAVRRPMLPARALTNNPWMLKRACA